MNKVIVRLATEEDIPAILEIYNDAIAHTTATFDLDLQTIDEKKLWFQQFNDVHPLFVAEINNNVVGYSSLTPFNKKEAYVKTVENSIYVHKDARGKGVANFLLEKLIIAAKEVKHHSIIALITQGNENSIKLHEKYHFTYVGVLREVGNKFDEWQDVSFYQLILE